MPARLLLSKITLNSSAPTSAIGITYIVASGLGQRLSFEHIYPALVHKKRHFPENLPGGVHGERSP